MNRFSLFEPLYRHSALGSGWSQSMIDWAVELLSGEMDTPSLRILAGLSLDTSEVQVREYFDATLAELGEAAPSENERLLGKVRFVAAGIVRGEVNPVEAVARVHHMAVGPLNHPAVLQPWCDLDSGFRDRLDAAEVERLEGEALDRAIVSFATDFTAADPTEQLRRLDTEAPPGAT